MNWDLRKDILRRLKIRVHVFSYSFVRAEIYRDSREIYRGFWIYSSCRWFLQIYFTIKLRILFSIYNNLNIFIFYFLGIYWFICVSKCIIILLLSLLHRTWNEIYNKIIISIFYQCINSYKSRNIFITWKHVT